jgi:hypothetical protein
MTVTQRTAGAALLAACENGCPSRSTNPPIKEAYLLLDGHTFVCQPQQSELAAAGGCQSFEAWMLEGGKFDERRTAAGKLNNRSISSCISAAKVVFEGLLVPECLFLRCC